MMMDIILHWLSDRMKDNDEKCTSVKELWDKIQNLYAKGSLHHEHEDNQNERSNTENEEHIQFDDDISGNSASEDKEDWKIKGVVDMKA